MMDNKTAPVIKTAPTAGGAKMHTPPSQNIRNWSTGLWSCGDTKCKTCLCICFCTPCWMCNITSRMNESCLVGWCVPGGVVALRTKLRTMFGINGSILCDWCAGTLCSACMLCQLERELDKLGM